MLRYFQACLRRLSWRPPALFVAALTLATATLPVQATSVTDRFVCSFGPVSRLIELTYLNEVNSLPCEIRETREDGQTRTLWRATFDVSFCERQMDVHRERLNALGWPCKSIDAEGNTVASARTEFTTTDALTPTVDAPGGLGLGIGLGTTTGATTELREPQQNVRLSPATQNVSDSGPDNDRSTNQVIFFEDSFTAADETSDKPAPPSFGPGLPSEEQLRQIDDWLIYLSAQSMASIRLILGDAESFSDYQITEDLNSSDIYMRLQNRIEFLQTLLEQQ